MRDKITDQYEDDGEKRQQLINFYLQYSPSSFSWNFLASTVHYMEEATAEELVKRFIRGTPGMGVVYLGVLLLPCMGLVCYAR